MNEGVTLILAEFPKVHVDQSTDALRYVDRWSKFLSMLKKPKNKFDITLGVSFELIKRSVALHARTAFQMTVSAQ